MSASISSKFSPDFLARLQANPEQQVAAIVRCEGPIAEYQAHAEALGLTVARQLRLINALAVEGAASDLLRLSDEAWVRKVEPDQPVHTMH